MPFRTRRSSAPLGLAALLIIAFVLAFASPLEAQVVSDPRVAEFDPSPDHWTILDNGQPAVVRYELSMYAVGSSAPFATVDMGKPSPAGDGKIRYDFSREAADWPLPGGEYEARVSAVGPEGAALSAPSNTFTFSDSPSCAASLSTMSVRAPAGGGDYSIAVSTGPACGWTATTTLPWVTLWATHGTASGSLPFQVQANSSTSSRSGIISIAGQAVTVSQDGAAPASTKTTPTLSWPTPAPVTQGTPLSVTQLNASASVAGTFAYSPAAGTVLPTGTQTLTVTFTPADTARYTTATASRSLSIIAAGSDPTPAGTGTQVVNDASVVADFDAAFDSVRQQYLVVWHTWNAEVKGLLLNAQGQALGSAFRIDTNALAARAAYSATRQAYLVTYTKGTARLARTVTATGGGAAAVGPVWALGPIEWIAGHGNPGGTAWVASTGSYLATWWDGSSTIRVRAVGASGPTGTATVLAAADVQEMPEIACGPTACLVVGRTWDLAIWGRWLNLSGGATSARFAISHEAGTPGLARVAYSESAGTFTVAWTRGGVPQTTTLAAGATAIGTVRPVVTGRFGTQLDLAFNSGLNAFALAAQGSASNIWAQSLDSLGAPLTATAAAVSEVATTDGRPVIVANPSTRQFLVIYRPTAYTLRTRFLGTASPGTSP